MSKVPAAENTLRILRSMASARGPISASALATQLGLPRSTVYHLLTVMEEQGFVLHYPEAKRYGVGPSAFELGGGYTRQQPLARLGRPLLESLVDRIGESGHLAVLSGRDVLYIVEERAPRRPSLVSDVGVRLPAHLTATGRAMLSALPAAQLRALYPDAQSFSSRGSDVWNYRRLTTLLGEVRAQGVAFEHGEVTAELASVGAVVRDTSGWPAASFAITYREEDFNAEQVAELTAHVTATAAELERRIRPRA